MCNYVHYVNYVCFDKLYFDNSNKIQVMDRRGYKHLLLSYENWLINILYSPWEQNRTTLYWKTIMVHLRFYQHKIYQFHVLIPQHCSPSCMCGLAVYSLCSLYSHVEKTCIWLQHFIKEGWPHKTSLNPPRVNDVPVTRK